MRCPVCRAENASGPQCRRCRADLSPLFALEEQRARAVAATCRHIAQGEGPEALAAVEAVEGLRPGEDARRLRALVHLLQRDFARAWRSYTSPDNHSPTAR